MKQSRIGHTPLISMRDSGSIGHRNQERSWSFPKSTRGVGFRQAEARRKIVKAQSDFLARLIDLLE
jgi:predicted NUDIX family NTP pyrophosphohydrolase